MEQKKKFIINTFYYVLILGIAYLGLKYLFPACFPFVLGFIFAYLAIKVSAKLFKNKNSALLKNITLVIIYLIIILVVTLIIISGINKIADFFSQIPSLYKNVIKPGFSILENSIYDLNVNLPIDVQEYLTKAVDGIFNSLESIILSASSVVVSLTTSILSGAPEAVITIFIIIISSFYIVNDYENMISYFSKHINEKIKNRLLEVKDFIENKILIILKSYLMIMCITFIELLIGLIVLGVNNNGVIALLISFLDILPVLGVGTILIPWGIISLVSGYTFLGIGLLILYIVIAVIRNIIEPRIVGGHLGLHPLAALAAMIIGVRLFGGLGMFGLPLILAFFISREKEKMDN